MSPKAYLQQTRKLINEHYTLGEEIANGVTHGIGAMLSIAGLVVLVVTAVLYGTTWHIVSFSIYGTSLIILYMASTLYHSIQIPKARPILRIIDHSSIYLLIAGTYTPFLLTALRGPWGWTLFGIVWGIALLGIIFKIFFINKLEVLSTLAYVGMGWLCVIAFKQMLATVPPPGVTWLVAGGVVYTIGVLFYAIKKIPYNHAIWHLFVLGGSICHFFAVSALLANS
ncbi:MAG: hemolysin III family protein [Ardenticatenaceae bacterium]|nr:hemolysin III family protein [Anaerolineales bacterium]MCB8922540.1 hemolysin III family protein [Ardenticatenaceae bacterium]